MARLPDNVKQLEGGTLGWRRLGTVALLGLAKRRGLIAALKPALDALVGHGIYLRRELIDAALREAGE